MVDFGRPAGDMYKSVYDADNSGVVDEVESLPDHAPDHQDGGDDEISVAALSGELADAQPVKAHDLAGGRHNAAILANLNTLISDATLDKDTDTRTPAAHEASHQDGGTDEIVATGLVGHINYVDRGDPATWDWDTGDFNTDGTWRELDCSSKVPAGAKAILFAIGITDELVTSKIRLGENGNNEDLNSFTTGLHVSLRTAFATGIVTCDADRKIQYNATNTTWTGISLIVRGWFI